MSSRSFFNIIIKIFGLFLLKDALRVSGNIIGACLTINSADARLFLITNLVPFFVYTGTTYVFFFHSDMIVRKLSLTKDIEEKIANNFHRSVVLNISLIVLAGYIFIDELPQTCQYLFWYYRDKVYLHDAPTHFVPQLTISITKIIIALLILRYHKHIVLFIERYRKHE